MTRVCVTWDREETARLVARCREKLAGCDKLPTSLQHAWGAVLDGIAATLGDGYQSRERDVEHALVSLAAIAAALGQEEGR